MGRFFLRMKWKTNWLYNIYICNWLYFLLVYMIGFKLHMQSLGCLRANILISPNRCRDRLPLNLDWHRRRRHIIFLGSDQSDDQTDDGNVSKYGCLKQFFCWKKIIFQDWDLKHAKIDGLATNQGGTFSKFLCEHREGSAPARSMLGATNWEGFKNMHIILDFFWAGYEMQHGGNVKVSIQNK